MDEDILRKKGFLEKLWKEEYSKLFLLRNELLNLCSIGIPLNNAVPCFLFQNRAENLLRRAEIKRVKENGSCLFSRDGLVLVLYSFIPLFLIQSEIKAALRERVFAQSKPCIRNLECSRAEKEQRLTGSENSNNSFNMCSRSSAQRINMNLLKLKIHHNFVCLFLSGLCESSPSFGLREEGNIIHTF